MERTEALVQPTTRLEVELCLSSLAVFLSLLLAQFLHWQPSPCITDGGVNLMRLAALYPVYDPQCVLLLRTRCMTHSDWDERRAGEHAGRGRPKCLRVACVLHPRTTDAAFACRLTLSSRPRVLRLAPSHNLRSRFQHEKGRVLPQHMRNPSLRYDWHPHLNVQRGGTALLVVLLRRGRHSYLWSACAIVRDPDLADRPCRHAIHSTPGALGSVLRSLQINP